jgi:branched-chain amino acid transport system ATP-binding protein
MIPALETRQVTKQFGGLVAVNKVDLSIPEHAIVSVIGPNGAGKTTFFNCVSGFYAPTSGDILFGRISLLETCSRQSNTARHPRTYQNIRLFKNMSALENTLVGEHIKLKSLWLEAIVHTTAEAGRSPSPEEAMRSAALCGLAGFGDQLTSQHAVWRPAPAEIARPGSKPMLLLDEPTAGRRTRTRRLT